MPSVLTADEKLTAEEMIFQVGVFDEFKDDNRIHVFGTDLKFLVMYDLAREGQIMFGKVQGRKEQQVVP
jgi:hypothetical protein